MPYLGAHMSIAGGYYKSAEAARVQHCQTVQLFTKNSNQWRGKPIAAAEAEQFRAAVIDAGLVFPTGHTSYLINVGSPDAALYEKSLGSLIEEVERAELLGLDYLVMHPGTPTDGDEPAGMARIAGALDEVHRRLPNARVRILLENTAGQGKTVGHRFEQLAQILSQVKQPKRLGVCIDTCHAFAAGYPLSTEAEYQATMAELERTVGLSRVCVFHLNDSKKPLGSRVDRHEHIGQGALGLEAFRLLLQDPRFAQHPMILETPKEDNSGEETMDAVNLATLRGLLRPVHRPRRK